MSSMTATHFVDTNVLLYVFTADPVFLAGSREALRASMVAGRLVAFPKVQGSRSLATVRG